MVRDRGQDLKEQQGDAESVTEHLRLYAMRCAVCDRRSVVRSSMGQGMIHEFSLSPDGEAGIDVPWMFRVERNLPYPGDTMRMYLCHACCVQRDADIVAVTFGARLLERGSGMLRHECVLSALQHYAMWTSPGVSTPTDQARFWCGIYEEVTDQLDGNLVPVKKEDQDA